MLERAYSQGMAIQSDWCRVNGQYVAAAASMGLLSTRTRDGFGRMWRVTSEGLQVLEGGPL